MKTLIIVRHAKSAKGDPGRRDFDRPLSGRGKRDAPVIARRLKTAGAVPEIAVSSPALRARQTAEAMADGMALAADAVRYEDELYSAGLEELVRAVRALEPGTSTVMLVGHNPGVSALAGWITNGTVGELPTCAAVVADFDIAEWREVGAGTAAVRIYEYPKKGD